MRFVPWITLAFVVCAALVPLLPGAAAALEYERGAVEDGAFWRPFTGQMVHWTGRMAATDLGAVLLLGSVLEIRSRRTALLAMAFGCLIAAAGLHLLPAPPVRYRGSSTLASALYVALAIDLWRRGGSAPVRAGALAALGLFLVKVGAESATGVAWFAGQMPAGVEVLARAHLLGAAGGALAAGLVRRPPAAPGHETRRMSD